MAISFNSVFKDVKSVSLSNGIEVLTRKGFDMIAWNGDIDFYRFSKFVDMDGRKISFEFEYKKDQWKVSVVGVKDKTIYYEDSNLRVESLFVTAFQKAVSKLLA